MKETRILEPFQTDEEYLRESRKELREKIMEYMNKLYKEPRDVDFNTILKELECSEDAYIEALRSTLKKPKIFLKRSSLEVGINCYNTDMLNLFESNVDIQFVVNEYAVASYIVNYLSKPEAGLFKLMREAAEEFKDGNKSLREKIRKISNVFNNATTMSAQEAVYLSLSMPISKTSRVTIFINTSPMNNRVRILKQNKDLHQLNPNDKNITVPDLMEKYSVRPNEYENICLADYAAEYTLVTESGFSSLRKRKQARIIRYVRYALAKDPQNYYREQCLLFLPWRNEKADIEDQNCSVLFNSHIELIKANQSKYSVVSDEEIETILGEIITEEDDDFDEEDKELREFIREQDQPVDIIEQGGTNSSDNQNDKTTKTRYFAPCKLTENASTMVKMQKCAISYWATF